MLKNEYMDIKIKIQNVNHYQSLGYKCEVGDVINIKSVDLPKLSKTKIDVVCDYCGNVVNTAYCNYTRNIETTIHKYACKHCKGIKTKQSNLLVYGTESVMNIQEYKQKQQNSLLNNYGVTVPAKNPTIVNKMKATSIELYGVDNVNKLDCFKRKQKETMLKRYGVDNPLKSDAVQKKQKETLQSRYGVDNPMKVKNFQEKCLSASNETKRKRGHILTSKQQIHINDLLHGELNYIVGVYPLDIAFPNEKIYIEYNGAGHYLSIKFGSKTLEECIQHDKDRQRYLKSLGWKELVIESKKDYLLKDDILINIINQKLNNLKTTGFYMETIFIDEYEERYKYRL